MSKQRVNIPLEFALKGMRTAQFAFFSDEFLSKEKVEYNISFDFKFDIQHRQTMVLLGLVYSQGKKMLCKLNTETSFEIRESSWNAFRKTEAGRIIPKSALAHFAHLALGSARGILHSKTENTALHAIILPLINVLEMIHEDVELIESVKEDL
jgi:hypothetical protein